MAMGHLCDGVDWVRHGRIAGPLSNAQQGNHVAKNVLAVEGFGVGLVPFSSLGLALALIERRHWPHYKEHTPLIT